MKSKYISLFAILCLLYCCKEKNNGFEIGFNSKIKLDTIYISELITKKPIAKIYESKKTKTVKLDFPTVANIHSINNNQEYLTILTQNKNLKISILPDSSLLLG